MTLPIKSLLLELHSFGMNSVFPLRVTIESITQRGKKRLKRDRMGFLQRSSVTPEVAAEWEERKSLHATQKTLAPL